MTTDPNNFENVVEKLPEVKKELEQTKKSETTLVSSPLTPNLMILPEVAKTQQIMIDDINAKKLQEQLDAKINGIKRYIANCKEEEKSISMKWVAFSLAEYLTLKYNFITLKGITEEMLYYDNGIYKPFAENIINMEVRDELEQDSNVYLVKETIAHVKAMTYEERDILNSNPKLLCLKNGVLDLDTYILKPNSPDYYFTTRLPLVYTPNAKCPLILKFLHEVLKEEDIMNIIELFGYCLLRSYPIHKAFMFVGEGRNGKSVTINILKAFLGKENCSGISLQDIENSKFAMGSLFGKLANLYPDLSAKSLSTTGKFKMLTGEDYMDTDQKFKGYLNFKNYAKLVFSCNQIPDVTEDTLALWARWIIISYPNQFLGSKADKKLTEKLTTEEELSGLLNEALIALKGLLERSDFYNTKGADDVREQYIRLSNPVGAFVMDCLEENSNGVMLKQQLYSAFCEYCRMVGYSPTSDSVFHRRLVQFKKLDAYRPKELSGRPYCWVGLVPKKDAEEKYHNLFSNLIEIKVSPYTMYVPKVSEQRDKPIEQKELGE